MNPFSCSGRNFSKTFTVRRLETEKMEGAGGGKEQPYVSILFLLFM
jgi:hypothetical protein